MELRTAQRQKSKIKIGLQGPSGSGKTYSALLLAFGLCGSWSKIAVIDTENHSADLYAHLGEYNVIDLTAPFTPEKYMDAITLCEKGAMEVIIVDSVSHEWENLLEYHSSMAGNSFTNWAKVTPRHNLFVQKVLQVPIHVIATMRIKQDYVLNEKNGKMVPEKVGLKSVQRDGLEYEFTLVFDLDMRNNATASKDRTNLFFNKPAFKLSIETGKIIQDWCNTSSELKPINIAERINECKTIQELLLLFQQYPQFREACKPEFETQKRRILINQTTKPQLSTQNLSKNGTV